MHPLIKRDYKILKKKKTFLGMKIYIDNSKLLLLLTSLMTFFSPTVRIGQTKHQNI